MKHSCEHLKNLSEDDFPPLREPLVCKECLKEGSRWVELRQCKACGHVGCCDSSPGRHATKHFREAKHPVMRPAMPRGRWTWCFAHQLAGELAPTAHAAGKESR
jgi:CPA1 family monovalent cation:H+ antiporter